jgi:cobalt-zinc-cadmium resistance protein CzcA
MRIKKLFVLLLTFLVGVLFAQTRKYSLQECIDFALKNNENIKTANYNIQSQREFKKAATEIPKTTVVFTQGQFNSIYKYDNNITFSQAIPNPKVFTSHNALAKAQIKSSEYNLEAAKSDLIYQIKVSYNSLLYSNAVNKVLLQEDSIYEAFAHAVNLKYKNSEATLLEKTTAETQVMEIKNEVTESEEDINNFQIELQTLMHIHEDIDIINRDFERSYLSVNADTSGISAHPLLQYYKQQIKVQEKNKSLEVAKILPDFSFGYFNQSIYGPANIFGEDYFLTTQNRLQGFLVGMTVPLWFYPQKSKIKAAELNTKLAESDFNYHTSMLEGQYKQAVTMYLKYRNSINYYQTKVLDNLDLIVVQAGKSYNSKEISYLDYLQVVSRALSIQRNYLNVIHQNNLYALKIEYLLSK